MDLDYEDDDYLGFPLAQETPEEYVSLPPLHPEPMYEYKDLDEELQKPYSIDNWYDLQQMIANQSIALQPRPQFYWKTSDDKHVRLKAVFENVKVLLKKNIRCMGTFSFREDGPMITFTTVGEQRDIIHVYMDDHLELLEIHYNYKWYNIISISSLNYEGELIQVVKELTRTDREVIPLALLQKCRDPAELKFFRDFYWFLTENNRGKLTVEFIDSKYTATFTLNHQVKDMVYQKIKIHVNYPSGVFYIIAPEGKCSVKIDDASYEKLTNYINVMPL